MNALLFQLWAQALPQVLVALRGPHSKAQGRAPSKKPRGFMEEGWYLHGEGDLLVLCLLWTVACLVSCPLGLEL